MIHYSEGICVWKQKCNNEALPRWVIMRYYMNILLECGLSMLIAAQFCTWYFPEWESSLPKGCSALLCSALSCTFLHLLSLSIHITCLLPVLASHAYNWTLALWFQSCRCGIGSIKVLSIPQTQLSSNKLFGSQLTATNSLVLMTRHIRKKGDKTKIKFLFQWPHHTGVLEHCMPSAIWI